MEKETTIKAVCLTKPMFTPPNKLFFSVKVNLHNSSENIYCTVLADWDDLPALNKRLDSGCRLELTGNLRAIKGRDGIYTLYLDCSRLKFLGEAEGTTKISKC